MPTPAGPAAGVVGAAGRWGTPPALPPAPAWRRSQFAEEGGAAQRDGEPSGTCAGPRLSSLQGRRPIGADRVSEQRRPGKMGVGAGVRHRALTRRGQTRPLPWRHEHNPTSAGQCPGAVTRDTHTACGSHGHTRESVQTGESPGNSEGEYRQHALCNCGRHGLSAPVRCERAPGRAEEPRGLSGYGAPSLRVELQAEPDRKAQDRAAPRVLKAKQP